MALRQTAAGRLGRLFAAARLHVSARSILALSANGRHRRASSGTNAHGNDAGRGLLLPGALLAAMSAITSFSYADENKDSMNQNLTADQCYKLCHSILEVIRSVYELPQHSGSSPASKAGSPVLPNGAKLPLPQVGLWYRSDKTPSDPSAGYEMMLRGVLDMRTVGDPALDRILLDGIAHALGILPPGQGQDAVDANSRTGEAWARAYHRAGAVIVVAALLLPIYPTVCAVLLQDLRNMLLAQGTAEDRAAAATDLMQSASSEQPRVYGIIPQGTQSAPVQTLSTLMSSFLDKTGGGRFVLHLDHSGGVLTIDTSDIQANGAGMVQVDWKPFPSGVHPSKASAEGAAAPGAAVTVTGVRPCDVIALNLVHAAMARMYRSSQALLVRVPWNDVERLAQLAVSDNAGVGRQLSTDTLTALGLYYGVDERGQPIYNDSMQPVIPEIPLVLQAGAAAQSLLKGRPAAGLGVQLAKAPVPAGAGAAATATGASRQGRAAIAEDDDDEEDVDLPGGSYGGGGLGAGQGGPAAVGQSRAKLDPRKTPKKFLRSMGIQIFAAPKPSLSSGSSDSSGAQAVPMDWEDLAGADETRQEVEDGVLLPLQFPELYAKMTAETRARTETNTHGAFLFVGPPGTGKTTTARIIAAKAKRPLVVLNFENIGSSFYAASENNLARVLEAVSCIEGAVLFVDEAESMFPSRYSSGGGSGDPAGGSGGTGGGHIAQAIGHKLLSQMLKFLEGMSGGAKNSIIFASNRARDLDPALLSRCAATVSFDLPDGPQREAIWARYAKHLSKADTQVLVKESEGMTGRDIKRIAEVAERRHLATLLRKDPAALAAAGLAPLPGSNASPASPDSDADSPSSSAPPLSMRVSPPPVSVYAEALEERAEGVLSLGGAAEGSGAFRRRRRQAKGMQWTRGPRPGEKSTAEDEVKKQAAAADAARSPSSPQGQAPARAPAPPFFKGSSPPSQAQHEPASPVPSPSVPVGSHAVEDREQTHQGQERTRTGSAGANGDKEAAAIGKEAPKKKNKQQNMHPALPKDIDV